MTRLWLIFFSLGCCCVFAYWSANRPLAHEAAVSGRIDITAHRPSQDKSEEGLSDIVVWLQPVRGTTAPPLRVEHVQLVQKGKMFRPHTLAVDVGSVVDFPNKDPIFHNAFSNFDGQLFDVGLYPPGTSKSVLLRSPGVVRVFCNIHPSMSAVIVVLDTPYFVKTGRDGRFRIPGVPDGTYKLHVFDERATNAPNSGGVITVTGGKAEMLLPPVHLSEAGYVQLPHKNKYGLDYPSSGEDTDMYHGPDK